MNTQGLGLSLLAENNYDCQPNFDTGAIKPNDVAPRGAEAVNGVAEAAQTLGAH